MALFWAVSLYGQESCTSRGNFLLDIASLHKNRHGSIKVGRKETVKLIVNLLYSTMSCFLFYFTNSKL
jgi:hypothetical protein